MEPSKNLVTAIGIAASSNNKLNGHMGLRISMGSRGFNERQYMGPHVPYTGNKTIKIKSILKGTKTQ